MLLMKFVVSQKIFERYSNIKFHENPSSRSRVVPCGRTDGQTDRQANRTKQGMAFRNFSKALKITCHRIALKVLNISRQLQVKIVYFHEVHSAYCVNVLLVSETIIEKNHNL